MSPCVSIISLRIAVVERAHRVAFAEDLERDALLDIAHAAAVVDQRFDGPATAC